MKLKKSLLFISLACIVVLAQAAVSFNPGPLTAKNTQAVQIAVEYPEALSFRLYTNGVVWKLWTGTNVVNMGLAADGTNFVFAFPPQTLPRGKYSIIAKAVDPATGAETDPSQNTFELTIQPGGPKRVGAL